MHVEHAYDLELDGGVILWRERRLADAGFDWPTAQALAGDGSMDLHELLNLVDAGCPPHLAVRILAPLDHPLPPC